MFIIVSKIKAPYIKIKTFFNLLLCNLISSRTLGIFTFYKDNNLFKMKLLLK